MTLRLPIPPLASVHELTRALEPSDAALVMRACAGDRVAEAAIYTRHVGYIANLCLRLLGTRHEAEDATQDTFVDAFEQLSSLREPERLRHWMSRVAVHKVHRIFRRRRLLRTLGLWRGSKEDEEEVALLPARQGLSPEQASELARIGKVLAGLPDAQRAAWSLRYVDGYKLEEVAALCQCSLASIKRRLAGADLAVHQHVQFAGDDHE